MQDAPLPTFQGEATVMHDMVDQAGRIQIQGLAHERTRGGLEPPQGGLAILRALTILEGLRHQRHAQVVLSGEGMDALGEHGLPDVRKVGGGQEHLRLTTGAHRVGILHAWERRERPEASGHRRMAEVL